MRSIGEGEEESGASYGVGGAAATEGKIGRSTREETRDRKSFQSEYDRLSGNSSREKGINRMQSVISYSNSP